MCKSLCSKFNIGHHSASELISKLKQVHFSSKRTDNIQGNQDTLIAAIAEFLNYDEYFLLDGHFCLIDQNENVIKIPNSTYKAMSPMAIILLHDDPTAIHLRLMERDKEKFNLNLLRCFQEEEVCYSKAIAADLAIPYLQANPLTEKEIIFNFVGNMLEKGEF